MCDVELMHDLYEQCKDVSFDEVDDLLRLTEVAI